MDDEIEDLIGDIKYTDSQKSVTTSNGYSFDFTDSSSDKNNSSGRDTYVIDYDDCDYIDSDKTFESHNKNIVNLNNQIINIKQNFDGQFEDVLKINRSASASLHNRCILAQETFTQTSKTIIQLAETEANLSKTSNKTLETQTSFICITENKIVEYKNELPNTHTKLIRNNVLSDIEQDSLCNLGCATYEKVINSLDNGSSNFNVTKNLSNSSSRYDILKCFDDKSEESIANEERLPRDNAYNFEILKSSMDIGEDSSKCKLTIVNVDKINDISSVPISVDNNVYELYNRMYEPEISKMNILTPLTEEYAKKDENIIDLTPNMNNINKIDNENEENVQFRNKAGINIEVLPLEDRAKENLKLPSVYNNYSSTNPNFNLFSINTSYYDPTKNTEYLNGGSKDRWENESKVLTSEESSHIIERNDSLQYREQYVQLPSIPLGHIKNNIIKLNSRNSKSSNLSSPSTKSTHDCISINESIKELKFINKNTKEITRPNYISATESKTSRSVSPSSISPESRLGDVAERGCEVLCTELMRRLRSNSWFKVVDTLEDMVNVLEQFWGVITENRIADLIRNVSTHVDSPRTRVARAACSTLASIIKNTNYTKKPDFYEAMTILLAKTGSFSRPVRRAANLALDEVVCGVDLTHAVTALCVHGASHKSPLVRGAAARLLVVCAALSRAGRSLLRTRPPAVASARAHALRALAALLDDRNVDTRKYAERLYVMLRPLSNFEAYYLTDVDVELASRQMKKYDQLLEGTHKKDR